MFAIRINLKNVGPTAYPVSLYEYRKEVPFFALTDSDGTQLMNAAQIRRNWNSWAKDYFRKDDRMTIEQAESQGYEIV